MSRRGRHRVFTPAVATIDGPASALVGAPVTEDALHIRFTDSKVVFRYTIDAIRGTGTVMHAREDGLCERTVTYDSQRWTCSCGVSGIVARSDDGIPYVDDEVLAHVPGDRS